MHTDHARLGLGRRRGFRVAALVVPVAAIVTLLGAPAFTSLDAIAYPQNS